MELSNAHTDLITIKPLVPYPKGFLPAAHHTRQTTSLDVIVSHITLYPIVVPVLVH